MAEGLHPSFVPHTKNFHRVIHQDAQRSGLHHKSRLPPSETAAENDSDNMKGASLIEELRAALKLLQAHIPEQERSEWIPCIKMVGNMLELRDQFGGLVAEKMEAMLRKMIDGGTNEPIFGDETGLLHCLH